MNEKVIGVDDANGILDDDEESSNTDLGVIQDVKNKRTPDCGKISTNKRERKCFLETRPKDGEAERQMKITTLLSQGKGNSLTQEK